MACPCKEDDVPNTNPTVVNSGSMWVSEPGRVTGAFGTEINRSERTEREVEGWDGKGNEGA